MSISDDLSDMLTNMGNSGAASGTGAAAPVSSVAATLLSAFGEQLQGAEHLAAGQQANIAAQFQSQQLRQNADETVAAAQHSAQDIQRQTDYITSRALAVAGASGGGASDPTVLNVIARTAGEGAYRQAVALYQGNDRARQMGMQADATAYGGQMNLNNAESIRNASDLGAVSTLMKGGTSLHSKYGGGGPNLNSGDNGPANSNSSSWLNS